MLIHQSIERINSVQIVRIVHSSEPSIFPSTILAMRVHFVLCIACMMYSVSSNHFVVCPRKVSAVTSP